MGLWVFATRLKIADSDEEYLIKVRASLVRSASLSCGCNVELIGFQGEAQCPTFARCEA